MCSQAKGIILHVIDQNIEWCTWYHVVHDLFRTNVFIIFILHKDVHVVVVLHFLALRGKHSDAVDVFPEAELFVRGKHRGSVIIFFRLGGDDGINRQRFDCDKYSDVSFAVVGHLGHAVGISHFLMSYMTDMVSGGCNLKRQILYV